MNKPYKKILDKNWINVRLGLKSVYVITEDLRIVDLDHNAGLSDFAKPFRKETTKLLGKSVNVVKLADAKLDVDNDWITYYFLTEYTPHSPKYKPQEVDPNDFSLHPTKTYEIHIRILDIRKWMDTYKITDKITKKDLKDILQVSSIKLWSSVPSFQYQGSNAILTTVFDAAIYPEERMPQYWDKFHNNDNMIDKHTQGIINSMSFWMNNMASMLQNRLKKKNLI